MTHNSLQGALFVCPPAFRWRVGTPGWRTSRRYLNMHYELVITTNWPVTARPYHELGGNRSMRPVALAWLYYTPMQAFASSPAEAIWARSVASLVMLILATPKLQTIRAFYRHSQLRMILADIWRRLQRQKNCLVWRPTLRFIYSSLPLINAGANQRRACQRFIWLYSLFGVLSFLPLWKRSRIKWRKFPLLLPYIIMDRITRLRTLLKIHRAHQSYASADVIYICSFDYDCCLCLLLLLLHRWCVLFYKNIVVWLWRVSSSHHV